MTTEKIQKSCQDLSSIFVYIKVVWIVVVNINNAV